MSQKQKWLYVDQKKKGMDVSLKIKQNEKWIYEIKSVKYRGIKIDNKFEWKAHIDGIAIKLIGANVMLYIVRDYVNTTTLKSVYHVLFELHIHYVCITLRLIYFKEPNAHTFPLFFKSKIKLSDKIEKFK